VCTGGETAITLDASDWKAVIDMSTISSPYGGSTIGKSDDVSGSALCGPDCLYRRLELEHRKLYGTDSLPEQGFSIILQPGERITFEIEVVGGDGWDSMYIFVLQGGNYPGDVYVLRGKVSQHVNEGKQALPVYLIAEGDGFLKEGDFVLTWAIDNPGMPPLPPPSDVRNSYYVTLLIMI
jgi:hypothetical protein